jgi:hypothetical protein
VIKIVDIDTAAARDEAGAVAPRAGRRRIRCMAEAPIFQQMIDRPDLTRERHARGEPVPLFRSYADPSVLTDEVSDCTCSRCFPRPSASTLFSVIITGSASITPQR